MFTHDSKILLCMSFEFFSLSIRFCSCSVEFKVNRYTFFASFSSHVTIKHHFFSFSSCFGTRQKLLVFGVRFPPPPPFGSLLDTFRIKSLFIAISTSHGRSGFYQWFMTMELAWFNVQHIWSVWFVKMHSIGWLCESKVLDYWLILAIFIISLAELS